MANGDVEQPKAKEEENVNTDAASYNLLEGLTNLFFPSRSVTPLSFMEEGRLTLLTYPEPSVADLISLLATKVSQAVSDSLDGLTQTKALDRVLGQSHLYRPRYGKGQQAQLIQPNSLMFFELLILAQTVHEFAPKYSTLEKNCYWFCNTVFNTCKLIYGQR